MLVFRALLWWVEPQPFKTLDNITGTFCNSGEDKVNIGAFFRRDFIEGDLFAFGVVKSSLLGDCSFFLHVDFIADDHGDNISLDELSCMIGVLLMVLC